MKIARDPANGWEKQINQRDKTRGGKQLAHISQLRNRKANTFTAFDYSAINPVRVPGVSRRRAILENHNKTMKKQRPRERERERERERNQLSGWEIKQIENHPDKNPVYRGDRVTMKEPDWRRALLYCKSAKARINVRKDDIIDAVLIE